MIVTGIDYFQGIGKFSSLKNLNGFLRRIGAEINDEISYSNRRFWTGISFDKSFKSLRGIKGGYSNEGDNLKAIIIASGEYLNQIPDHLKWAREIRHRVKVTRVDIRLDDYRRRVTSEQLKRVVEKGNYTLLEASKILDSKISFGSPKEGTIYFGSPKSNKLIRFYNAETIHEISADRWEAQFRRERAELVWDEILNLTNQADLAQFVTGSVDFRDREQGDKNLSRCPRLEFWQSLIDEAAGAYNESLPPKNPSLEKTLRWLDRQVGPSLAMVYDGYGEEYLVKCIAQWRQKYNNFQQLTIKEMRGQNG